jgi:RPA family protein
MSESGDSGPGLREVAHRIFAAEFDDAEFSYSESDEERAPNYVVTPTGARANRLFAVGVLTELEQVNDEVLRARVVDPTGAFVVYAGQYQPEALAFLEGATPPLFVAVTGKARTFEPEDGDRVFTSVRPEAISEVDAETRDRWVVQAAEQTVARVGRLASARQSGLSGDALKQALVAAGVSESDADGAALALEYYDTTGDYLQAVRELALNATRVVAGERDEAGTLSRDPGDGTDDPLASLMTMDLEAPAETASVAPSDESATGGDEPATPNVESDESTVDAEPSVTADTDGDTTASESADSTDTEGEPSTETTGEPTRSTTDTSADSEPATAPESASTADVADEGNEETLGDTTAGVDGTTDDDVGDFDTEFELDEDEREEIETEYGTDFQSGTEVDDAGEADIETPDSEEVAEAEAPAEADEAATADDSGAADESATDAPPAEDVDLEDAVMDVMTDLNDGSGADREAVITEVMDTYGADRAAVEESIQDALMGGRCYEPDDDKLTPI